MNGHNDNVKPGTRAIRRVLVIALGLNAAMFAIEMAAGLGADSVALQADALDFFSGHRDLCPQPRGSRHEPGAPHRRSVVQRRLDGADGSLGSRRHGACGVAQPLPSVEVMGAVGVAALGVNIGVALLLYRFRGGDSNMRSVWLCSRNDAIGNLAVLAAAAGVFGTGTVWPNLAVAALMATLALVASLQIIRHALAERRGALIAAE